MSHLFKSDTFSLIRTRSLQRRALIVALIVGTLLNGINQGPELLAGGQLHIGRMCLTFLVPYCVSLYSAATAIGHNSNNTD